MTRHGALRRAWHALRRWFGGLAVTTPVYPGDFTGRVSITYSPHLDGRPDPGEVVWAWVPFEEDHTRGKDRPVLLIGRADEWLLGLMLSSKDPRDDPRRSRNWRSIGTGPWDARGRASAVRLDRVLRIDPRRVRREGAVLPYERFTDVTHSLTRFHRW